MWRPVCRQLLSDSLQISHQPLLQQVETEHWDKINLGQIDASCFFLAFVPVEPVESVSPKGFTRAESGSRAWGRGRVVQTNIKCPKFFLVNCSHKCSCHMCESIYKWIKSRFRSEPLVQVRAQPWELRFKECRLEKEWRGVEEVSHHQDPWQWFTVIHKRSSS